MKKGVTKGTSQRPMGGSVFKKFPSPNGALI